MISRLKKIAFKGIIAAAAGLSYYFICIFTNFRIPCLIHFRTGLYCPGCGITGFMINIIQLDFASAFRHNAIIFILMPFYLILSGKNLYRYIRYGKWQLTYAEKLFIYSTIALLILFGIIRNVPGFEALRPPYN